MLWTTWTVTGEMGRTTETERRNMDRSDRQNQGREYTRTQKDVGLVCCVVGLILFVTVMVLLF